MHLKDSCLACYPRLTVNAAIVALLALSFLILSVHASSPWVEVHPPRIKEAVHGIELIHFIDADTGWAEAHGFLVDDQGAWLSQEEEVVLRTSDGGRSWQRADPPAIFHDYLGFRRTRTHFISPTLGWKLGDDPPPGGFRANAAPMLVDDIEFYHTSDGGLTWQLRRGSVTEPVLLGDGRPMPPGEGKRLGSTCIHFIDERFGWLIGYTDAWWFGRGQEEPELIVGNFFYSTRDGGNTWKCRVKLFPWAGAVDLGPSFRRPVDMDFISREIGWITQPRKSMYRTADGGMSWEWTDHPHPSAVFGIGDIDFVDESRGWAVGEGVWITSDGGQTWTEKLSGGYGPIFADVSRVWVVESHELPSEEWGTRIIHSRDDGNTWQGEWEGPHYITYIGYHEVTKTLWAGGADGVILKRTQPVTNVTAQGKLSTLWGKLKAGGDTNP